jgi:sulfatase modifying factor 1
MEGLTPVYQIGGSTYKSGEVAPTVNASANGYRLPSEKEWEWAARGGVSGVSHSYVYSGSNTASEVAWTSENSSSGTKPVGTKLANELGIYDMSGNVWEWCWDGSIDLARRIRGGGWGSGSEHVSIANRDVTSYSGSRFYSYGFRLARNSGTPDTTAPVIAITSISANARLTSANATFGGTITENGSKPTLQYRLGTTGNWTASTVSGNASPYSFSQLVALTPGLNTVQFQSKDDAENVSALASIDVSYVVASTLTITAPNAADGSVTSGFGGSTSREVGVSYTVTATPASGMVFKEWLKNGVSAGTNATLSFTMEPGLNLTPVFVPNFAALGGFYNGLVGVGAIGSGSAADMQAFAANNGFIQITSGTNGVLSGVLKIEGKSHSFNGTMGANKRATIAVPRPGKSNATLSLSLVSALPGEISGNVTTSGAPLAFRALRAAYTAGAAKHALAGKRYAIVLPPPSGLAMGFGHATLTVEDNGAAVLSGVLANAQAVNAGARIVDDGAGNWVFPVYVGASGIFTGEIVIPKTTPASGSELGGSIEWLKPASNKGLFKSGFLKSLQPLGATHSMTSAGLGGAAFSLTLDSAKRILPAAVVQTGTWANSGSPILATPVKSGLTLRFNPLSGKFEGSFTRTVNGAPLPTPIQGTLFSRPITIPSGATLRGAGFFMSGNASTAIEITSNGTAEPSANMVTVQGGALPSGSGLAGQVVAAFQIGKYETTWGEWKTVRDWAVANNKGYDLAGVGGAYPAGSGDNFPVAYVSWYDVVKWSNARSEKEGLTPVYQVSGATYKTGQSVPTLNASANGYRLPSEKEWEWAARGGVSSQGYTYSGSNTISAVGWTYENSSDGSKAVGTKAANELGIYDMSGNVWEWSEDVANTSYRRIRGGSWNPRADNAAVANRGSSITPDIRYDSVGFRLVRSSGN